jgi:hypothetical protein
MMNSFAGTCSQVQLCLAREQFHPIHRARHRSREHAIDAAAICGNFPAVMEPVEATSVFYSGTSPAGKLPPSIRFPFKPILPETSR